MVKFIDIAEKNLKTLFRNKKGLLFMILIPILFYSIMGSIFGGSDTTTNPNIYKIGWVDQDSSESGNPYKNLDYIYNTINNMQDYEINNYTNSDAALSDLESKKIDSVIIFPEDYELYLNGTLAQIPENITIYFRDSSSDVIRNIISSTLIGVIDGIVNYNPASIKINYSEDTISGIEINQLTLGTPGYLMYGILSALTGGIILITSERKEGLLKRLESSRMKPRDMLLGHLVSNTAIVFIQFTIAIATLSIFGFSPVFHDLFSLIFGVLITVFLLSIFQNALALIASSVLKTPDAAGGRIWVLLIPLMTFSGAFFPLEFVAPNIIPYVGWIPTRIVVILFQDLMVNAVSVWNTSILLQFMWLALEGIVLFFIGTKLYRNFVQS